MYSMKTKGVLSPVPPTPDTGETVNLPFTPNFIPNNFRGTDIYNGNGERLATTNSDDGTWWGYVTRGDGTWIYVGFEDTDKAAIQMVLRYLATH